MAAERTQIDQQIPIGRTRRRLDRAFHRTVVRGARSVQQRLFGSYVYAPRRGFFAGFRVVGRIPGLELVRMRRDGAALRELRALEGLDLDGWVAYDVGAQFGTHTFLLRRLVGPAGAVYAFEPEPIARARVTGPARGGDARARGRQGPQRHAPPLGPGRAPGRLVRRERPARSRPDQDRRRGLRAGGPRRLLRDRRPGAARHLRRGARDRPVRAASRSRATS